MTSLLATWGPDSHVHENSTNTLLPDSTFKTQVGFQE